MSDISTLHQRLNQLVQGSVVPSGRVRVLVSDGETDLRGAMRAEISETQLPRRVTFRNGAKETLAFDVVAGRVLRRPDDLPLMRSRVDAFVQHTTVLEVETERLNPGAATLEVGIALDDLFPTPIEQAQLGSMVPTTDGVTGFVEACRGQCVAGLVVIEGGDTLAFGADAQLAKLHRLAEAEKDGGIASLEPSSATAYPSQCVVYCGHPLASWTVVCVSHARSLGFAILSEDALGPVLDMWKTHFVGAMRYKP